MANFTVDGSDGGHPAGGAAADSREALDAFDALERRIWSGRAAAYAASFARLCAHPVPALLDAAAVGPGRAVLDVGTGTGTAAAAACARGARVTAVDAEPSMPVPRQAAPARRDARHALSPHRPKTQVHPVRGLPAGTPRA
ncbi:hypothetical protein ACWEO5_17345, partial [Kitasatospora sp. NPDC004272]